MVNSIKLSAISCIELHFVKSGTAFMFLQVQKSNLSKA